MNVNQTGIVLTPLEGTAFFGLVMEPINMQLLCNSNCRSHMMGLLHTEAICLRF